ncbi:MAG TPA: prepilin peptidase [Persephonella sp.]|uniref:Prepilin leader peptidase/N-methyltransferase n=1 Tax=Persephonella marina (strain DSM 14350 / EX-H1) TaxID=123214 RepID=C0QSP8_PERMH|nr:MULTISPECIES: A24 family peptidase [Persephonella]ACO04637.1 leader peptidase PppA [Persephonella marina EX-H1]HCB69441.1 prepilin peptidase [Persephonella sp.]
MGENTLLSFTAFIFGLIIGSFLNVLIYRLPRGKTALKPAFSFCPSCGNKIKWYDNIPVISYIILKGRCRYCNSRISLRYPLVEILTGMASVFSFIKTGLSLDFIFVFLFLSLMIVITFIDIDFRIIPDQLNLAGFLSGIIYTYFRNDFSMIDAFTGALTGAGILFGIAYFYLKVRGIEGLGMGDVKLMAFVGSYLGWFGALFTIFVGSFIGAVVGIIGAYISRSEDKGKFEIPFGPFLALSATVYLFFGESIKNWYLGF